MSGVRNSPTQSQPKIQTQITPSRATNECGDFCGDPLFISVHLKTSQPSWLQQAKLLNQKTLQGFLSSFQRVSKLGRKGFVNRRSGVRFPSPAPVLQGLSRPTKEPPSTISYNMGCSRIQKHLCHFMNCFALGR